MEASKMFPFKGTLIGFSGEQVQELGYLSIKSIFRSGDNAKFILVRYLILNASSPYNIIIGKPKFNALEAALSMLLFDHEIPARRWVD